MLYLGTTEYGVAEITVGAVESHKNIQAYHGMVATRTSSLSASGVKVTCAKSGTYKISWMAARNTTSGTSSTRLYISGSAYGTEVTTWTNSYGQSVVLNNVQLTEGQVVEVYARARSTSYYTLVGNLIIEEI